MTFPKFIFVMLWVNEQRVKIPRDVLVVSPRLQADYCLRWSYTNFTRWRLVSVRLKLLSTELLVGRGWIFVWKKSSVHWDFMYNACNWFEFVILLFEEENVLTSSYWRTLLFYNSELKSLSSTYALKLWVSMARSAEKMFMLPVSKAKALNIVVGRPCWKYGGADLLSFNCLSMAFLEIKKTWTGCLLDSLGKNLLKRTYCFRFFLFLS